jgi:penicillin-binding protein 1B
VDAVPAYLLRYGMEQVMREGTGKSAYRRLPNSVHFAGKTGTTNDYRDSWFAGFSPDVTAVVWLGRDDNARTSLTGATGPLTIWTEIMRQLPHRHGKIEPPRGVEFKPVNPQGLYMDPRYCSGGRELPFSYETQLQPAPGCARRGGWWRDWFGGEEPEAAPREEMSPGWGIDPRQRQREQQQQRERQLQEQLQQEEPYPQEQPPREGWPQQAQPQDIPRSERERLQRLEEQRRIQEQQYLEEERRAQEERRILEERLRRQEELMRERQRGAPVEEAEPWSPDQEDQWP